MLALLLKGLASYKPQTLAQVVWLPSSVLVPQAVLTLPGPLGEKKTLQIRPYVTLSAFSNALSQSEAHSKHLNYWRKTPKKKKVFLLDLYSK